MRYKEEKKEKIKVTFLPEGKKVTLISPISLKEAINKANIDFRFPCGGKGLCGKCKVKVEGNVNSPTSKEKEVISDFLNKGYRLACQVILKGDAQVEIPASSLISDLQILTEYSKEKLKIDPSVKKLYIHLPKPTLEDQISDVTRIKREFEKKGFGRLKVELDIAKKIPYLLRKSDFKVTLVVDDGELIALEKNDTRGKNFGVAFDIGTTTLVGTLVDLDTGEKVATKALLNPQISYGDDVISRISYIQENPNRLAELQREVLEGINKIISDLQKTTGVKKENIYQATFVGNTVMQHLLLGINPLNLALYPYVPVIQDPVVVQSFKIGVNINPFGKVYIFPNIAAFIGGDTVGVILATGLHQKNKKIRLAVDIGTNGEIVLSYKGKLIAASTAAGPAFEGARITQGMWAQKGAIEKVKLEEGKVIVQTIGGGEPQGICGSGLIDIVSELYREGIIDISGRIKSPEEQPDVWKKRVVRDENGSKFILVEREKKPHLFISQKDIREFQLAKAAICTGIKMLLMFSNIEREHIEEVLIAGAFGNYINIQNAFQIGLFPTFPNAEIKNVGNAASMGAIKALLSKTYRKEAEKIPSQVQYVELAANPHFQDILTESILLGEQGN